MRYVLIGTIALFLSSCATLSPKLDESTGTTKAQRCADYRGFLATATVLQETQPSDSRAARIAYYKAFIGANCGG